MNDIHDIRGPIMVGMDPGLVKLVMAIAAALVGVLLIALVIRYFWKKQKGGPAVEPPVLVPAQDRAIKALDRLESGGFHDPKAFYFNLGHIVKAYLSQVVHHGFLEMTTPEMNRALQGADLETPLRRRIIQFQDVCDPFRYAPITPKPDQMHTDLVTARTLVKEVEAHLSARAAALNPDGQAENTH